MMRTTLTLDDDIAIRIKGRLKTSGVSFKDLVNDLIRKGLETSRPGRRAGKFKIKPIELGLKEGFSYDNVSELLDQIGEEQL